MPARPVLQLEQVYQAFAGFRPGSAREYDRTDFARDLFLLESSGQTTLPSGETLSLPASSGTRGGKTFSFVTKDGETVVYYGIRFS